MKACLRKTYRTDEFRMESVGAQVRAIIGRPGRESWSLN